MHVALQGERPSRQYDRPNRSDNNDRPTRSYGNDRPTRSYDNDRPTRSYDNDRPTRSYDNDRPTRSYDNDRPTRSYDSGDRPQRSYDRSGSPGEGGQGQRRSRPPPRQNEMTRQINGEIQQATNFQQLYEILQSRQDSLDSFHIIAMLLKVGKGEVTGPQTDAERGSYEELIALLYGWMASQVASYNPNQLATALYGIGKLNYYNAEIVTALTDKSYLILAQLKPIELSNTMWAFARLGVSPGEPWLKQFEYRSKAKLSQFRGVELSNTIASMARLGYRPEDEWMAEFAASAAQQLRYARAQELTNILWGMASLGYHPGGEMLEELLSAVQAQMSYAKVADLVKQMYAMTQYDSRPSPEFLTGFTASFTNQIRYVTGQDLASVLYSMAFLQVGAGWGWGWVVHCCWVVWLYGCLLTRLAVSMGVHGSTVTLPDRVPC